MVKDIGFGLLMLAKELSFFVNTPGAEGFLAGGNSGMADFRGQRYKHLCKTAHGFLSFCSLNPAVEIALKYALTFCPVADRAGIVEK